MVEVSGDFFSSVKIESTPSVGEGGADKHLFISSSELGYHPLFEAEADSGEMSVIGVVGKEERVFVVDPFVLKKDPFQALLRLTERRADGGRIDGSE
ncbi:hypothetical protein ACLOJK_029417 [Asimina triloba]